MGPESIRALLPQLLFALIKSGARQPTINSFRAYWNALPPAASKLPCPLCYANGQQGWLLPLTIKGAVRSAKCERCGTNYLARAPKVH